MDYIYSNEEYKKLGFKHNIAVEFLLTQNIGRVDAMDGNLSYTKIGASYIPRLAVNQDGFKYYTPKGFLGYQRNPVGKVQYYLANGQIKYWEPWLTH